MSLEEQVAWYKSQYEQLETELAEFRVSSQELEQELEKDLEAAEKRENSLRKKAETLKYEVDEWKVRFCFVPICTVFLSLLVADQHLLLAEKTQGFQDRDQRRPKYS